MRDSGQCTPLIITHTLYAYGQTEDKNMPGHFCDIFQETVQIGQKTEQEEFLSISVNLTSSFLS